MATRDGTRGVGCVSCCGLRAKTREAQFAIQYQRKNKEGGNFVPDMWGPGRDLNYLLQMQPNPISTASSLIEQVVIRRLLLGNAFVYIERNEFGASPLNLWLADCGGYNELTGTYTLTYLGDMGVKFKVDAPREDVLHFPNTFRYQKTAFGVCPTNSVCRRHSLTHQDGEQPGTGNSQKGGRMKAFIGEQGHLSWLFAYQSGTV